MEKFIWEPETPVCSVCSEICTEGETWYSDDHDWQEADNILCEECYNETWCKECEDYKNYCDCEEDEWGEM